MASKKTAIVKIRLARANRKNRQIPRWKFNMKGFKQQYNFKFRYKGKSNLKIR